jgi:hypothetical protein
MIGALGRDTDHKREDRGIVSEDLECAIGDASGVEFEERSPEGAAWAGAVIEWAILWSKKKKKKNPEPELREK